MHPDITELFLPLDRSGRELVTAGRPAAPAPPQAHTTQMGLWQTLMLRVGRVRRRRTHTVVRADRHWHTWMRIHTPMWGSRRGGRIVLRPAPRFFTAVLICLLLGWVLVLLTDTFSVVTRQIAMAFTAGLVASYIASCPAPRIGWVRAEALQPGDMVRQPMRPLSARIVSSTHTINAITYIHFHNGPDRTYQAHRDVTLVQPRSRRHLRWHYGRSYATTR